MDNNMIKEININNKKYIFDGRTLELYELKNEDELNELLNQKIEVPFEHNYKNDNVLHKLTLNMSNKCNLHCKYCYANGGNYYREDAIMSKETFDLIINNLKSRNIKDIIEVKFFGGEPLLNSNLIKYAMSILDKEFNVSRFLIVTNGILLSYEFVKECMKYNCYFAISLDGPKFINDFLRGKNSFDKTINNLEKCFNNEFKDKVQLLCTYTPYHLKQGFSKEKLIKYFEKLDFKYVITKVGSSDNFFKFDDKIEEQNIYNDIDLSFKSVLNNDIGKPINSIVYEVLLAIAYNQKTYSFCDELNINNLSYDFNGDEYICYRFWGKNKYNLKNLNYKQEYDKINNKKYKSKCSKCWARYLCTICPANILDKLINVKIGVFDNECIKLDYYEYCLKIFCKSYDSGDAQILIDNFGNFIKQS